MFSFTFLPFTNRVLYIMNINNQLPPNQVDPVVLNWIRSVIMLIGDIPKIKDSIRFVPIFIIPKAILLKRVFGKDTI